TYINGRRPREEYIKTILNPNSWGGAIGSYLYFQGGLQPTPFLSHEELSIFSTIYQTEICSIDIETGRVDKFGEGASYRDRVILLYSGIHYDATSLAPTPGSPPDWHQTNFPVNNDAILLAGKDLAGKLRAQKKFTNTGTFLLKCEVRT
ncbi:MAG TPA: hypothetical protein VGO47_02310, partial [Chlamydiales bacterium]|nr:hypothetical protein [Chlamydiales bacterium]